jgi:hypothetical protein
MFRSLCFLESLRLLAWGGFMTWLLTSRFADGSGPEAVLPSITAAQVLGFPYSWVAAFIAGDWLLVDVGFHPAVGTAFGHFVVWAVATLLLIAALRKQAAMKIARLFAGSALCSLILAVPVSLYVLTRYNTSGFLTTYLCTWPCITVLAVVGYVVSTKSIDP